MPYTANKKISGLDSATAPLAAGNQIVLEQSGSVVQATLAQVEAKVFDAKTAKTIVDGTEVVIVRQTDNTLRQVPLDNIVKPLLITNAMVSNSADIADSKLAQITSANKVANSATTASASAGNNTIVLRDGSGNFAAGTVTATLNGDCTGNAGTATNLSSNRTFALTGNVTGSVSSNLSSGASISTTIANNAVTTVRIADSNVTTAKLADAAVTTAKMADLNVTTGKLADAAVTDAKLRNSAARSVIGRASDTAGAPADITAATDGHVLRRSGTSIGFGTIATAGIANNAVTNAILRDSAALSVVGRSADSSGDPADISAGTDGHVLRRSGTSLGFGQIAAAGITDLAITTAKIADGAVTQAKLENSGVSAGTYNNNAAQVRPFTVDVKGRVTSVGAAVPIEIDAAAVTGTPFKRPVAVATTANLTATYDNGSSGVGATLTNSGTLGALSVDGFANFSAGVSRVLVKNQTTAAQNGIYTVTNTGSPTEAWVLTRATDSDQAGEAAGAVVTVNRGTANGGNAYTTNFKSTSTVGTAAQNWFQVVTTGDSQTVSTTMIADSNVTTAKIADANVTTAKIADSNVTTAKLASDTQQGLIPAGAVMPFARTTPPAGWLEANGDVVPNGTGTVQGVTANFAALRAAVGSSFGAAGTLPNLNGVFVRGRGQQLVGANTYMGTYGSTQGDQFRRHTHAISTGNSAASSSDFTDPVRGSGTGSINSRAGGGAGGLHVLDDTDVGLDAGSITATGNGTTTVSAPDYTIKYTGGPSTNTSSSLPGETRPANVSLLYCIKY